MIGLRQIAHVAVLLALTQGPGCADSTTPAVSGPSLTPPIVQPGPPAVIPTVMRFWDPVTDYIASDVYDAHDQIVQFSTSNELVLADGSHFPGFKAESNIVVVDPQYACLFPQFGCYLEVRFGTWNGERRAYLTYLRGEESSGMLVDLAVNGDILTVAFTDLSPPGTYTLSGTITEDTGSGPMPVEGADVWLDSAYVAEVARGTDSNGFFQIHGLYDGPARITVFKHGSPGFPTPEQRVVINSNTRWDFVVKHQP